MPTTIFTELGLAKITQAAGSSSQVAISHVALGDGNGAAYEGDPDQTALRREKARIPIESRYQIEPNVWYIKAEFGPDIPVFHAREVGFFDPDGDLIAIRSFPASEVRKTGAYSYLIQHAMNFSAAADGLMFVDAPDDDLFHHAVLNIETHAITALEQFKLREMFRDLQAAL